MSADATQAGDSVELEALFESIALAAPKGEPKPQPKAQPQGEADDADSDELQALFDQIAQSDPAEEPAPMQALAMPAESVRSEPHACEKVINSVGQLTRKLHDTLKELGYDREFQEISAAALPDARQRIEYVVTLTEQAASRSINAVELATPVQESLAADAESLAARWDAVFGGTADVAQFKALADETRAYLRGVPARTETTRAHLREVMMAQEFQDLTGQVLKRVTELANNLEGQLLKLLVENAQQPIRNTEALGLLNGPAIDGGSNPNVLANQQQVDELLESLGF